MPPATKIVIRLIASTLCALSMRCHMRNCLKESWSAKRAQKYRRKFLTWIAQERRRLSGWKIATYRLRPKSRPGPRRAENRADGLKQCAIAGAVARSGGGGLNLRCPQPSAAVREERPALRAKGEP